VLHQSLVIAFFQDIEDEAIANSLVRYI
jgi:hypothetical protein